MPVVRDIALDIPFEAVLRRLGKVGNLQLKPEMRRILDELHR